MQSADAMNTGLIARVLLMLWLGAGVLRLDAANAERARLGGKSYLRLTDWAQANRFEVRWLKRDETVQLSHGSWRLCLSANSREAHINGVGIWLLFPLLPHEGVYWISELDTQTTFRPILSPPRAKPAEKLKTICVDPGHGGKDPGNQAGANQEKRFTLALAQEVRDQLARAGFRVSLTRNSDRFVELPTRSELARRRRADLFISLHFNSAEESRDSVHGLEVYSLTPAGASSTNARREGGTVEWCRGNRHNDENLFLAFSLQKALKQQLGLEDRGVRRARFAVLRDADMPAALIEGGFMSHPTEGRKIFSRTYRQELAAAIVQGILSYKRTVERF